MMSSTSNPCFQLGQARVLNSHPLEDSSARWIGLKSIDWIDESGKQRKWECSYRKKVNNNQSSDQDFKFDAVAIFALVSRPNLPLSTIIIRQYRPPVDKIVVELPAGLIDQGETPETTALRELYEETGYGKGPKGGHAIVEEITNVLVNDPGMSNANMVLAKVSIKLEKADEVPEPQQEQGEHIQVELVQLKDLYQTLQMYNRKDGYVVDARLMHLAWGIAIQSSIS